MPRNFLILFLLLMLALLVQSGFKNIFGWTPDFVLAALFSISFFADFLTILFLSLFSAWILNWQPVLSWEIILLIIMPLVVFLLRNRLPYSPWLNNLIVILAGLVVFYSGGSRFLFLDNFLVFFQSALGALAGGAIIFAVLSNVWKT